MGLRGPGATRGPLSLGNDVRLAATVSSEVDRALTQLVELSGISKTTFVRQALLNELATLGLVYPEIAKSLEHTPTAGRLSTGTTQKRK